MKINMFFLVFAALVTLIIPSSATAGPSDDEFTKIQLTMIDHESIHRQLYNRCLQEYPETAQSFKEGITRWGEKNYPALKEFRLIFRDIEVTNGKSINDADAEISKKSKVMTEGLQAQFAKMPTAEMQKVCSGQFVEMLFSQMDFAGLLDKYRTKMNNKIVTKQSVAKPTKKKPVKLEQTFADPIAGMEFILVKGACFEMGDTFGDGESNEKPVHKVCVDDFYIGKYAVTVGQFRKFINDTGYRPMSEKGGCSTVVTGGRWTIDRKTNWHSLGFSQDDNHPVVCVTWHDAVEFSQWLSRTSGQSYRLPTEAEWEYAARSGGKKEKYAGFSEENQMYFYGNFCDSNCEFSGKISGQNDGYKYTAPVGSYKPNDLGLYDMTGNVWQWCSDRAGLDWGKYYAESPRDNPQGPASGAGRALRGGSWGDKPSSIRAASRSAEYASMANVKFGFRLVSTPDQ